MQDRVNVRAPASRWRRGSNAVEWIMPSITLILLPKCPICMAAYVALFTGVGISMAAASILRTSLLILAIAALLRLVLKYLRRPLTERSGSRY